MEVEVEDMQFEVKGWRLRECISRLRGQVEVEEV